MFPKFRRITTLLAAGIGSIMSAEMSRAQNLQDFLHEPPVQRVVAGSPDELLLDEIQRRAVLYLVEQTDPSTGLTRDRAPADGGESLIPASIATSGFALTGWCIADARGWMKTEEARARVLKTLQFVADHVAHEHGWFYHFIDARNGQRAWLSEASTIDTALFLSGALMAREYFDDAEVRRWVDRIYARIDWRWALNGGTTLTHGWKPETGFIPWRWDSYSELLGMYLLGIGAPANALPAESWYAWKREPVVHYGGRTYLDCGPLFTHQFSHAWFDFRGQRDAHTDFWKNSVDATLGQREWSAAQAARFPRWSKDLWGLTASDSARGYIAWGGPGGDGGKFADGTVVPCAPGGSLPFAPEECLATLHRMREVGGEGVWKRYGFVDAFNPQNGWTASDVIGIDLGIMLLMAENLRSELVWRVFMKAPEVRLGMWLAGFRSDAPRHPVATVKVASAL
ncbi:MAG TPA: glucoamylase family protein [Opitutus sp.]|nr:glucoamylase family protein [Opitutus sp.]